MERLARTTGTSWPPKGFLFGPSSSGHQLWASDGAGGPVERGLRLGGRGSASPGLRRVLPPTTPPPLRRGQKREVAKAETATPPPRAPPRAPHGRALRPARGRASIHLSVRARRRRRRLAAAAAQLCGDLPGRAASSRPSASSPIHGRGARPAPWPPGAVSAGPSPGWALGGWGSPHAQPPREQPRPSGGGPASLPPSAPPRREPRHGALRMRRGAGAGLRARSGVVSAAPRAPPARAPRRGHAVVHLARHQGHPGGALHLRHPAHPLRDPLVHLPRCGLRPRHLRAAGPAPRRAEGRPGVRHGGRGAGRGAPPPRPRAPPPAPPARDLHDGPDGAGPPKGCRNPGRPGLFRSSVLQVAVKMP
ncbi:basic proline-rich protein-like [Cervus canadensis]|uniref:basic proline-rich protein-like n=1 Tax=Cervus canadensis TaxID=1574408 RepID=UPI001CA326BC|nr:basic proline-rich protein-like [Cervus canadensis]